MDDLNIIRAGIFFIAGLLTILFRKNLNSLRILMLKKFNLKNTLKNELESYYSTGVVLIVISIILFLFSVIK